MYTQEIKAAITNLLEAQKAFEEAQKTIQRLYQEDDLPQWTIVIIDGVAYDVKITDDGQVTITKSEFYVIT